MTRTPLRSPSSSWLILAAAFAAVASCRGGCRRGADAEAEATAKGRLALFPIAARVVVSVEVSRLRDSPAADKLSTLVAESQADKETLAAFQRRTGLDPVKQISSITLAFPEEARAGGEFGLVLRGDVFDETRLVAYVRDQLQKSGDDLVASKRGRFTLWSSRRDPAVAGFFVDEHTFVLGGGSWGPRMAELAETARPGDSAATNLDLVHLVERAAASHAIWGAAMVPEETRRTLAADPKLAEAASIATLYGGVDLGKGLEAELKADVASPAAAKSLASKVTESLRDAKRNPQVLMLGLGPYLDGISARAVDRTFELRAKLSEAAVDDLVGRIAAMLQLARSEAIPGFPGAGLPGAPP
jgi:hypothetical protein